MPEQVDLFDRGVSQGETPRLWIDVVAHVVMGRDKRIYRFVQDTRFGRIVIAESHDVPVIVDAVTGYVARRMIEREHAMVATPVAEPVRRKSRAAAASGMFVLGFLLGAVALFGAGAVCEPEESLALGRRSSGIGGIGGSVNIADTRSSSCWWPRCSAASGCTASGARCSRGRIHPHLPLAARAARAAGEASPRASRARTARWSRAACGSFFLAYLMSGKRHVPMPSQVADDLWHEFILVHARLRRAFCRRAFGGFLHHTPPSCSSEHRRSNEGPAPGLVVLLQIREHRSGPPDAAAAAVRARQQAQYRKRLRLSA